MSISKIPLVWAQSTIYSPADRIKTEFGAAAAIAVYRVPVPGATVTVDTLAVNIQTTQIKRFLK